MVGRYGDAIKVQVGAPPEDGKANRAVLELLSAALGVKPTALEPLKLSPLPLLPAVTVGVFTNVPLLPLLELSTAVPSLKFQ